MKLFDFRHLLFIVVAALGMAASAATYHVATTGSDETGNGTEGNPFYSLKPALALAQDGDTILIGEGDFTALANDDVASYTEKDAQGNLAWGSTFFAVVDKAVTIRGAGEAKTLLKCRNNTGYVASGFQLNHKGAVVENLAVYGGLVANGWSTHLYYRGAAFDILAGTVRNVRVFNNKVSANASRPVVYVGGADAVFADSIVTNNGCGTYGRSAVVNCKGGTVSNCYFTACTTGSEIGSYGRACGVAMEGGLCCDCTFEGIQGGSSAGAAGLSAIGGSSVVERCLFRNNELAAHDWCGAALSQHGNSTELIVRNCVFIGNKISGSNANSGGAVFFDRSLARMYHCTIINNQSSSGGGGAFINQGSASGCIIWGNTGAAATKDVKGNAPTWSCYENATPTAANHNLNTDPLINTVNFAPFAPEVIDAMKNGSNLVTDDFNGRARPVYGASEDDYPDMGAVEVDKEDEGELIAVLEPFDRRVPHGTTPTLRASFAAKDMTLESCIFTLAKGGVETVLPGEGLERTLPADLDYGTYDVVVRIENSKGLVGTCRGDALFTVMPSECYVSVDGAEEFPYDTPAKAFRTLHRAVDSVCGTAENPAVVHVTDGDYGEMEIKTWEFERAGARKSVSALAFIDSPIRIIGNAAHPENVRIAFTNATSSIGGGFYLENAAAEVTGLTVNGRSGRWGTCGGSSPIGLGLHLISGVVSNCVFRDVTQGFVADQGIADPPVSVVGGLARNIVCRDIDFGRPGQIGGAQGRTRLGLYVGGGVVDGLLVENIKFADPDTTAIAGLDLVGGTVSNLVVRNVSVTDTEWETDFFAVGVRQTGGTLVNAWIEGSTNNTARSGKKGFAGFVSTGGTARNVLVNGCRTLSSDSDLAGAGLRLAGGTVVNATVAGNAASGVAFAGLSASSGTLVNTLVWANESEAETPIYLTRTGGAFSHCCIAGLPAEKDADGNFAADPRFKRNARTLLNASPCVNAGVNADWMVGATDLAGNPRIFNKTVDIGCYENLQRGLSLVFR